MDRYAVAGNPVAHSQSPFIHAAFARQTGQRLDYGRLLCPVDGPPGGLARALQAFAAPDARGTARGCNVTVPFKFEAFALAPRRTERAALAGAANTLCFDAEGWLADNTDGCGLVRDIEHNAGVSLAGKRLLLIGAGGAAAGVLGPLLGAGPARLVVANRTLDKAQALVARHREAAAGGNAAGAGASAAGSASLSMNVPAALSAALSAALPVALPAALSAAPLDDCGAGFDVVINASASSLQGGAVPVAAATLAPGALAVDLMYGAKAQAFVEWAQAHGAVARDGLGMLVEQAAESFFLWRGVRPDTAPVLAALHLRMAAGR